MTTQHDSKEEQNILDIIDGCTDDTKYEETQKILAKFRFASLLQQKTLKTEELSLMDLEEAVYTSVYLGMNTDVLVDELLWKAGETQETFEKYFYTLNVYNFRAELQDEKKFGISRAYAPVLHRELKKMLSQTQEKKCVSQTQEKKFVSETQEKKISHCTFAYERVHARFHDHVCIKTCAKIGNLRLLKYLIDNPQDSYTKCNHDSVCTEAASGGFLECLKILHKSGYKWNAFTCAYAAQNGHLECLKYAHENGCPWNEDTCEYAAMGGHLACLRYAHESGCEWREEIGLDAATGGNLECLKYVHENGCKWDISICHNAAYCGHLDCLKYAHTHGCSWDEETCMNAAEGGRLKCLQYAHEHGCEWEEDTCRFAAYHGNLECLKYAHENGCVWNKLTCEYAAKNGHLECLKYAHENGCEWDARVCALAARHGHLECLKYAHEFGCKWDRRTLEEAKKPKNVHDEEVEESFGRRCQCSEYATKEGCPNIIIGVLVDDDFDYNSDLDSSEEL